MPRSPQSLLSRALALVVLLASLVAVPALTTPAAAASPGFSGKIQGGATITADTGRIIDTVYYYRDQQCQRLVVGYPVGQKIFTIDGFVDANPEYQYWVQVDTRDSSTNTLYPGGCLGPAGPNGPSFSSVTYTGTLKVDATLTAVQGSVIQSVVGYTDAACDLPSATTAGAGNPTYVISANFANQYVKVTTATSPGGTQTVGACVGPVAQGTFDALATPTFAPDLQVGVQTTATAPNVPEGTIVTYQWRNAQGQVSLGQNFTPGPELAGVPVFLRIVASRQGYTLAFRDSEAVKVAPRAFDEDAIEGLSLVDSTPTTPLVPGDEVSFDQGEGTFPEDTTFTVRFGTPNTLQPADCDVFESNLETYEVSGDEIGKKVCARVTVEAEGYGTENLTLFTETVQGLFSDAEAGFDVAPQVDVESTVKLAGLDPQADEITYVWTIDEEEVSDEATYTPVPADAGKTVEVEVTVAKENYASRTFTTSATVAKGVLKGYDAAVEGEAQVGRRLTAGFGADDAPEGSTLSYAWGVQLPGEERCESIGVITRSYLLPKSAKGSKVCVTVTIELDGYETYTTTSPTTETVTGLDPQVWLPSIDDTTPTFGQTLTASVDERDLPSDAEVSYQWGRFLDGRFVPIDGATGEEYVVALDDIDERLGVRSTVSAFGYEDGSATSRSTAPVEKAVFEGGAVELDGTPTVDAEVGVDVTDPSPEPTTTTTVWTVGDGDGDGDGVEAETFTPEGGDAGETLTVTVTFSRDGYEDTVVTDSATIAEATFTGASVEIDGTPTVDAGFTADVTDPDQEPDEVSTVWTLDDEPIAADAVLQPSDAGKTLTVTVTFSRKGYEDEVVSDSATVVKASFEGGSVELDGSPTVDAPVSADIDGPTPKSTSRTVEWTVAGTEVETDEDGSYTPTAADAGKTLAVTVTFSRDGYEDEVVSDSATVARASFEGGSVALSARPTVGQVVSARPTAPTPSPTTTSYAWTVDGRIVSTSSTYKPLPADRGKRVEVTVRWTRAGYVDRTVASTSTTVAAAPQRVVSNKTTVRRGESFVVTGTGLKPGQPAHVRLAGVVVWKGRADQYGTVNRTVRFSSATKPGARLVVRVSGFDKVSKGVYSQRSYTRTTGVTLTR